MIIFLTFYHSVHNSYGRAVVLLDGKELVRFSWNAGIKQEADISDFPGPFSEADKALQREWNEAGVLSEGDFLAAALAFRKMSLREALSADSYILKLFAVLDRRLGKRTLLKLEAEKDFEGYPPWIRQFFLLRLKAEGLRC